MEEIFGGVGGGGGGVDLTIGGNSTSGGGGYALISSGTARIAGGANITVSQDGNSLTIIGNTNSGATTFLAGISTAGNTLGTTGVVNNQLLLVGGTNITLSQSTNGQSATLTISGANVGTPIMGVSTGGNTLGTTGMASGIGPRLLLVGGTNVTLSQSLDAGASSATVTIIGPTQSVQPAQTGISSIQASDTTYTSGKVIFTGAGAVTVSSGANQSVIINAPVQSAQPEGTVIFGVSTGGNTIGTTGMASGTGPRLVFVGGANITLSQSLDAGASSGTVTIIGATGGSGGGLGALADGVGSSVTGGTVQFANQNGITFGLTGSTVTASFSGGAGGGINASISGNSTSGGAGYIDITNGTMYLAGGNNITLSQDGHSITISAPSGGGAGISSAGNTAGTSGTVDAQLIFVGGSNISLSQSIDAGGHSGTITINGASGGAGGGATVNGSTGNVSFAAGNNMSLSTNGSTLTYINVLSSSGIAQNVSNVSSAGTLSSRFALADHAHIGVAGINMSGTASTFVGNVMISAGNNLTMSTGGNSSAGTVELFNLLSSSGIAQNVSNVSSAGTLSSRFALADHAHIGVAGLNVSGTASTWVGNVMLSVTNLTLVTGGNSSAGSIGISAAAAGAGGAAIGITNTGNTSGTNFTTTSGTVYFQGTNNITVSNSTAANIQTIWISGPTGGGAGMGNVAGTSGTSGSVAKQLFLYPGANVGLSQSMDGASLSGSLSVVNMLSSGNSAARVSNVSSAGTAASSYALADHAHLGVAGIVPNATASSFVGYVNLSGGSNISLASGGNSSAGSIAIHNLGAGTGFTTGTTTGAWSATHNSAGLSMVQPTMTRFMVPDYQHLTALSVPGQGSASIQYVAMPDNLTGSRIDALFGWAGASTASAVTAAVVISAWAAIYTRNVSTLSSLSSGSTQTTYTYASNSAGQTQLISSAIRPVSVPVNFNLQPGEYFVAFNMSTNSSSIGAATTNLAQTISVYGGNDMQTALNYAEFTNQTAASTHLYGGMGVYTAQTAGLPAAISLSAIAQTGTSLSQANIALVFRNA